MRLCACTLRESPFHCIGLYHILPHDWLRAWRRYIRNHQAPRPTPPESSSLLCDAHMLPLVSPHISEFLDGDRETPFHRLGEHDRTNQVLGEILSDDEFEALMRMYPSDFHLAFAVDPDFLRVCWRTEPCHICDAGHCGVRVEVRRPLEL